jgi:uncharacterized protein (UPF0261 family)
MELLTVFDKLGSRLYYLSRRGKGGVMTKAIAIFASLDTKGEEVSYVKELIAKRGHKVIVVDTGVLGRVPFPPDITRDQVAEAAGTSLNEIIAFANEGKAMAAMGQGAAKVAQELYSSGKLDGVFSMGGSMGTSVAVAVMKALPLVMPKLLVSTVALTPMISPDVVGKDLTIMPPVADIWGLNRITKRVLENAAGAIAGMVETHRKEEVAEKPLIGITTLGAPTLSYVLWAKPLLEQMGYEVAIFHTIGVGGMSYEQLVEQGAFAGALDLSLFELTNRLCGGPAAADRLEATGKRAMPQVVAPGALNFFGWWQPLEMLPAQYRDRKMRMHSPIAAQIKASVEEMAALGELIAKKLNKALGPTAVLIPNRGFSEYDSEGGIFSDPRDIKAFVQALKGNIEPKVEVIELDMHINDPEFARKAVAILDGMLRK